MKQGRLLKKTILCVWIIAISMILIPAAAAATEGGDATACECDAAR